MKIMNECDANGFYYAVRRFLTEEWGRNCAGPWWEGGLQLEFGCSLMKSLEGDLVEVKPPSFLGAWPQPIRTRRLAALNYAAGTGGRGWTFADFRYWCPGDREYWNIELKLWSVDGNRPLVSQVEGCVSGLEADAAKALNDPDHYGFVLLAVNIPNRFAEQNVRRTYSPDEFKDKLIERIHDSKALEQLAAEQGTGGSRGDWCAAIKRINGRIVEDVGICSSVPDLRWPAVNR